MKQTKTAITCLMAVVLMTVVAAITANAAAPALNGQLGLRPLTPQEIKTYSLTGVQSASGLSTVAIGQPAYFDALVNRDIAPSDIVSVTWVLTNKPAFSTAVLTNSPLGTNVPTYNMVDRLTLQVAGRTMFRPDLVGQYTVRATIVTAGSGTVTLTQTITAGTYLGVNTCALCHSGGLLASNMVTPWLGTAHSGAFARAINGESTDHFTKNCISCHSVGFDANTNSANGGFDDVAAQVGWTFPTVLAPTNWAYMQAVYPSLANVANIQCENCHGPGSQHAYSLGSTNLISKTLGSGSCAQCHDSLSHHIKTAEWNNSRHAVAVEETDASCSRCHTAKGFANYAAGVPAKATPYDVITCAACHEPHSAAYTNQLRTLAPVKLMDNKTTITSATAGKGLLCMNCHMSRRDATNYVEITAGSSRFGPHHGPQADMLAGANAVNYGKVIASSTHNAVVGDACVTCHMQEVASTSPAFTHAGGHSFSLSYDTGTNTIELTDACVDCHGPISSFNFVRQDYDGNGVQEGVQTEVRGLLSKLALMLPPVGVAKTNHSPSNLTITSSWTKPQLRAAYNYLFVVEDGSYGIHNLSYAVGLLKASIASLTGDSNNDSLPDAWQTQYFGSPNNPNAAPNAAPAGDGVPNWLKYSLGLDPTVPGLVVPGGVVWANGKQIGGGTNTIQIYTAAEVSFNTEVGKSYQVQAVSSLSSGWQNVGAPIPGTGNAISYVTPTRTNVQQYYRVYSY